MPIYKASIEIEVDGDDIEWVEDVLDEIREMDGVNLKEVAMYSDNPPDYPEEE